jgi:hypothetical protein
MHAIRKTPLNLAGCSERNPSNLDSDTAIFFYLKVLCISSSVSKGFQENEAMEQSLLQKLTATDIVNKFSFSVKTIVPLLS